MGGISGTTKFSSSAEGYCAHEFILDLRPFKECGIDEVDVAKRLQDFGFHGPTMSWPVPGTLMIEPTESEPLSELNRLIEAFECIREEIREVEEGKIAAADSALRHAPHTMEVSSLRKVFYSLMILGNYG